MGNNLLYSTYIGGNNGDSGQGIALDCSGNVFVTGITNSSNFPATSGAYDISFNGTGDIFVLKLNASGNELIYSTYIGGNSSNIGQRIALDSSGNAFVMGETRSSDFPVTCGAFDTSFNGGEHDVFILKLNASGSMLLYSTFLGSSSDDVGRGLAVDCSGNTYVVGTTRSSDFPVTSGAFDTSYNGGPDVFVTKLDAWGSALLFSTFLGGSGLDLGLGIALDNYGNAFVMGDTDSGDFPVTSGAFDTSFNSYDIFVTKLNSVGNNLLYSTFIGGNHMDIGQDITLDSSGNAYVVGEIFSPDFPVTCDAFDTSLDGSANGSITMLNTSGSTLIYSTFLGGSGFDIAGGIAIDNAGNVYVVGCATSSDFPVSIGAYDTTYNGGQDGFVIKLSIAETSTKRVSLREAAKAGLIGGYLYQWDNFLSKYHAPILVTLPYTLSPYETYWIEVFEDDLILLANYPYSGSDAPLFPANLESDKWYQVTLPINPSQTGADVRDTFISWSDGALDKNTYGNAWRIYKYKYDALGSGLSDKMFHYGDTGKFNNFIAPGQGYIYKYISPGVTMNRFVCPDTQGQTSDMRLRIPLYPDTDNDGFTLHMVGNPFRRELDVATNIKIEYSTIPLAKPASIPLDQIKTWHIALSLKSSLAGVNPDEYNRAGVATNYTGKTRALCALDMTSPDKYVRLALKNPSDTKNIRFAYDFRPSGEREYVWDLELTTTYTNISSTLSLSNLDAIPDEYRISLIDKKTGEILDITDDMSIDVELSSMAPKEFELKAVREIPYTNDINGPGVFRIAGVMPNPFNPIVSISYLMPVREYVKIRVYNISGQLIETLVDSKMDAGIHTATWNASSHLNFLT
jgi:hypothetical protein